MIDELDSTKKASPQQQKPTNTNTQNSSESLTRSFFGGRTVNSPIQRNLGSDDLIKLKKALDDIYKEQTEEIYEIKVIPLLSEEFGLDYSYLLICVMDKTFSTKYISWYALLIEGTGNQTSNSYIENINRENIEIYVAPEDTMNTIFILRAREKLRKEYPNLDIHPKLEENEKDNAYFVEGLVIPSNFNIEDKIKLHNLALNSGLACVSELDRRRQGFMDISLADMDRSSSSSKSLIVKLEFNDDNQTDYLGNPIRSDIAVKFGSVNQTRQKQNKFNDGDRDTTLTTLLGYMDLFWSPVNNKTNIYAPFGVNQQINQNTQKFVAMYVITQINTLSVYTIGSILLAIETALVLNRDNSWYHTFRPTPEIKGIIDLKDIGALNIEGNLPGINDQNQPGIYGKPIETKGQNNQFTLNDLGSLLSALIRPEIVIAIDVPLAGTQTWYTSMFLAAAKGDVYAKKCIYESAMRLTNNNFGKYFNPGDVFFEDAMKIHLGYYTNKDGKIRDIRDFDYLAIANLSGYNNASDIKLWSDTWVPNINYEEINFAKRKKMIFEASGRTAKFTGKAFRVIPSAKFLSALNQGCIEAGLAVQIDSSLSSNDYNINRSAFDFSRAMVKQGESLSVIPSGSFFGGRSFDPNTFNNWRNQ